MERQELTDNEVQAIAERTATCLNAQYKQLWIDRDTHYQDHMWIDAERSRQQEVREFRRKIIQGAALWAVVGVLGFLVLSAWHGMVDAARDLLTTGMGE